MNNLNIELKGSGFTKPGKRECSEKEFRIACKNELPEYISADGIQYKIFYYGIGSDGFTIGYSEYNGDQFTWKYQMGNRNYYGGWKLSEIITDYKVYLKSLNFAVINEIVTDDVIFHRELSALLNRFSKQNASNTSPHILSTYLMNCLYAFNTAIQHSDCK